MSMRGSLERSERVIGLTTPEARKMEIVYERNLVLLSSKTFHLT